MEERQPFLGPRLASSTRVLLGFSLSMESVRLR
jgi:hypothetical protein